MGGTALGLRGTRAGRENARTPAAAGHRDAGTGSVFRMELAASRRYARSGK
jgi:hypothetical protein